jgi:hypothetical protein
MPSKSCRVRIRLPIALAGRLRRQAAAERARIDQLILQAIRRDLKDAPAKLPPDYSE